MFCLEKLAKHKAQIKYDDIDEWFKVGERSNLFSRLCLEFARPHQGTELPRSYEAFALKFSRHKPCRKEWK